MKITLDAVVSPCYLGRYVDRKEQDMENSKDPRFRKYGVQVVFILVILYAISSINVLMLAYGLLQYLPGAFLNPSVIVAFALISFVLTILTSVYHLATMLRGRKRKVDHQ
jgi:hypothetical protein